MKNKQKDNFESTIKEQRSYICSLEKKISELKDNDKTAKSLNLKDEISEYMAAFAVEFVTESSFRELQEQYHKLNALCQDLCPHPRKCLTTQRANPPLAWCSNCGAPSAVSLEQIVDHDKKLRILELKDELSNLES